MPRVVMQARARSVVNKYHEVPEESFDRPRIRASSKNSLGPDPSAAHGIIPYIGQDVDIPSARLSGISVAWEKAGKQAEAAVLANAHQRIAKRRSKLPVHNPNGSRKLLESRTTSVPPTLILTDLPEEDCTDAVSTTHAADVSPSPASTRSGKPRHDSSSKITALPSSKRASRVPPAGKRSPPKSRPTTTLHTPSNAKRGTILSDITEADSERHVSDRGLDARLMASKTVASTTPATQRPNASYEAFTSPRIAPRPPTPNLSRWSSSTKSSDGPLTPTLASVHRVYNSVKERHRSRRAAALSKSAPTTPKASRLSSGSPIQRPISQDVRTTPHTLKSKHSIRKLLKLSASAPASRLPSLILTEQHRKSEASSSNTSSSGPTRKSCHSRSPSSLSLGKTCKKSVSFLKFCNPGSRESFHFEAFNIHVAMSRRSPGTADSTPSVSPRTTRNFSRPLGLASHDFASDQSPSHSSDVNNIVEQSYSRSEHDSDSSSGRASPPSHTIHALTTSETSYNGASASSTGVGNRTILRSASNLLANSEKTNSAGSDRDNDSRVRVCGNRTFSTTPTLNAPPTCQSTPTLVERSSASSSESASGPTSTPGISSTASKSCPSFRALHHEHPLGHVAIDLDAPVMPGSYPDPQPIAINGAVRPFSSPELLSTGIFTSCGRKCDFAIHTVVGKVKAFVDSVSSKAASWCSKDDLGPSQEILDPGHKLDVGRELKANQCHSSDETTIPTSPLREAALAAAEREATLRTLEGQQRAVIRLKGHRWVGGAEEDITSGAARQNALQALTGEKTNNAGAGVVTRPSGTGAGASAGAIEGTTVNKRKNKALPPPPPMTPHIPPRTTSRNATLRSVKAPFEIYLEGTRSSPTTRIHSSTERPHYLKHKRSRANTLKGDRHSDEIIPVSPPTRDDSATSRPYAMQKNELGQNVDTYGLYSRLLQQDQESGSSRGFEAIQGDIVGLGITFRD